ncbi:MAG: hypothetical protein WAQ24_05085 [Candidatus Saccharimonadales bacterium]
MSLFAVCALAVPARAAAGTGFDEYGYNDKARTFVGTCASWAAAKGMDGQAYCGVYAKDHLVMKWNKVWDDCNAAGYDTASICAGAWNTNQWNGRVPGGSGETYQYKQIWVGSDGEMSPYWREGGTLIWGNYETIFEKLAGKNGEFYVHVTPGGLGRVPKP